MKSQHEIGQGAYNITTNSHAARPQMRKWKAPTKTKAKSMAKRSIAAIKKASCNMASSP